MGTRAIDENGNHICDDQGYGYCWICGAWMTSEAVAHTLRELAEWLDNPHNPCPVLDFGSGKGYTAGYLLRRVAGDLDAA